MELTLTETMEWNVDIARLEARRGCQGRMSGITERLGRDNRKIVMRIRGEEGGYIKFPLPESSIIVTLISGCLPPLPTISLPSPAAAEPISFASLLSFSGVPSGPANGAEINFRTSSRVLGGFGNATTLLHKSL